MLIFHRVIFLQWANPFERRPILGCLVVTDPEISVIQHPPAQFLGTYRGITGFLSLALCINLLNDKRLNSLPLKGLQALREDLEIE